MKHWTGPLRGAGQGILGQFLGVAALLLLFLAFIVVTGGALRGWVAWAAMVATGGCIAQWHRRRRRAPGFGTAPAVVGAALLAITVCLPTVSTDPQTPRDLPQVATQWWRLQTGSRVAAYHYPPRPGATSRVARLLYLHGGPIRSIALMDHRFLSRFAEAGYDVFLYEQAGGDRSDLLQIDDYGIERELADLDAVLERLGPGPVDVVGFSAGGALLSRALADPAVASRIRRAVIVEPGPMDGPTAAQSGPLGRPTAAGLAAPPAGPRSTTLPRYAAAFGLMRLGLLLPNNDLVGQGEGRNAFSMADLGADTANSSCAKDAGRIPSEDSPANFAFNVAASLQVMETIKSSASIVAGLRASRTPAMVVIAECSSQMRTWATSIIEADPAVTRVQYLRGVGHHVWTGLDDNDVRAEAVIAAFLEDRPPPVPNWPSRDDIPTFLRDGG